MPAWLRRQAAESALREQAERSQALAARAESAEAERDSLAARLENAPVNAAGEVLPMVASLGNASPISSAGRDYGRYFALVIGNSEHQFLSELSTAKNDARRVSEMLVERYGFEVTRIDNADNISVLAALNQLHDALGPDDNLLIYYAGYGNERTDEQMQIGYWLPVNAQRPPIDTYWVPVGQMSLIWRDSQLVACWSLRTPLSRGCWLIPQLSSWLFPLSCLPAIVTYPSGMRTDRGC